MSRSPRSNTGVIVLLVILILLFAAGSGLMICLCLDLPNHIPEPETGGSSVALPSPEQTEPTTEATTEPTLPDPEHVVSTATITSTGDVLMHMPVIDSGLQTDGSYNFDSIFRYVSPYTSAADLAVANLETTLCGTDNGYPYHGYPNFNCPDEIVTGLRTAGFDMLLTANNHSYDTGLVGYKRTIDTVRDAGLVTLGTMKSADEPKYSIQEINGIKIGMLCYTYAYSVNAEGSPSLNGMPHISETGICNFFHADNLEAFYTEVDGYLQEMEAAGAEATIMYIHWGVEYQTYANDQQKAISQKLCDLGLDVIIGGHPHVVQPISLLESTVDPEHKTVCLYSMGNAVSNQRLGKITSISTAHTEDGMLFYVTFSKYSDGAVYLESVSVTPTWVRAIDVNGNTVVRDSATITRYEILPLDISRESQWREMFGVDDATYQQLCDSYTRTMEVVGGPGGGGLGDAINYLTAEQIARETDYETATRPAA